jgi:NADPH-dependent glutamate synthase beta subunit-like oxidoreductase
MHAIDLLRDHHVGKEVPIKAEQKVVVVVGGNVAIDAARPAKMASILVMPFSSTAIQSPRPRMAPRTSSGSQDISGA